MATELRNEKGRQNHHHYRSQPFVSSVAADRGPAPSPWDWRRRPSFVVSELTRSPLSSSATTPLARELSGRRTIRISHMANLLARFISLARRRRRLMRTTLNLFRLGHFWPGAILHENGRAGSAEGRVNNLPIAPPARRSLVFATRRRTINKWPASGSLTQPPKAPAGFISFWIAQSVDINDYDDYQPAIAIRHDRGQRSRARARLLGRRKPRKSQVEAKVSSRFGPRQSSGQIPRSARP